MVRSPSSDLFLDGELTAADIDEAYRLIRDGGQPQIASAEPNPDPAGVIDKADIDFLVRILLGTQYGDTNLDGAVGNADFGIILGNFGATDAGWAGGDLNGDGSVVGGCIVVVGVLNRGIAAIGDCVTR